MRKLFSFFFLVLLSLSLVSAGVCTEPGFALCSENSFSYGSATAYAKVFLTNPMDLSADNQPQLGYAVDKLFISVDFVGDKLYAYKNTPWAGVSCDANGCNGERINPGDYVIANVGENYKDCHSFVAHDYASSGGDWSWTWTGYGWALDGGCFNIKVVDCYDNTDCGQNQFCDKSGDWTEWTCRDAECTGDQTKCEGFDYYTCENFKWKNEGPVPDQCGVECVLDEQCPGDEVSENFCSDSNIVKETRSYSCKLPEDTIILHSVADVIVEDYQCGFATEQELIEECPVFCDAGVCTETEPIIVDEEEPEFKEEGFIELIGGLAPITKDKTLNGIILIVAGFLVGLILFGRR